jgi:hypothetical protein
MPAKRAAMLSRSFLMLIFAFEYKGTETDETEQIRSTNAPFRSVNAG